VAPLFSSLKTLAFSSRRLPASKTLPSLGEVSLPRSVLNTTLDKVASSSDSDYLSRRPPPLVFPLSSLH